MVRTLLYLFALSLSFCVSARAQSTATIVIPVATQILVESLGLLPDRFESAVGNGKLRYDVPLQRRAEEELLAALSSQENAELLSTRQMLEVRSLLKKGLGPLLTTPSDAKTVEKETEPTRAFVRRVFAVALAKAERNGTIEPGTAQKLPVKLRIGCARRLE